MTSPVLDEKMMIDALGTKATMPNAATLQAGAFALVLDAWDRDATREHFMTALATALSLYDNLGWLALVTNIIKHVDTHKSATKTDLLIAQQTCTDMAQAQALECLKMARLLTQCALDGERIQ